MHGGADFFVGSVEQQGDAVCIKAGGKDAFLPRDHAVGRLEGRFGEGVGHPVARGEQHARRMHLAHSRNTLYVRAQRLRKKTVVLRDVVRVVAPRKAEVEGGAMPLADASPTGGKACGKAGDTQKIGRGEVGDAV